MPTNQFLSHLAKKYLRNFYFNKKIITKLPPEGIMNAQKSFSICNVGVLFQNGHWWYVLRSINYDQNR